MTALRATVPQSITAMIAPYTMASGRLWDRALSSRKEIGWVIAGQVMAAAGGIFGVRLLTHYLPPTAYGELALGLTLTTLCQQCFLSPFSGASLRFFSTAREASELRPFLKALSHVQGLASLGVALLLAIAIPILLATGHPTRILLMAACACFALISSANATLGGLQTGARHRAIVAWHDGLGVWLRFLLGAFLVILCGPDAVNVVAGYGIAALLIFVSQYTFFERQILASDTSPTSPTHFEKWEHAILRYGWPFASWGIFVWAQSASERWALKIFSTTTEVGQYAVLFQLSYYPMIMGSGVLMQIVSPFIFRIAADGRSAEQVRSAQRWVLALTSLAILGSAGAALLVSSLHETIFHWFTARPYWPVSHLMPWMLFSSGLFAASQVAGLAAMSTPSPKHLVAPKIISSCVAVALNILGAFIAGVQGIVWANLAFSMLLLAWTIRAAMKGA